MQGRFGRRGGSGSMPRSRAPIGRGLTEAVDVWRTPHGRTQDATDLRVQGAGDGDGPDPLPECGRGLVRRRADRRPFERRTREGARKTGSNWSTCTCSAQPPWRPSTPRTPSPASRPPWRLIAAAAVRPRGADAGSHSGGTGGYWVCPLSPQKRVPRHRRANTPARARLDRLVERDERERRPNCEGSDSRPRRCLESPTAAEGEAPSVGKRPCAESGVPRACCVIPGAATAQLSRTNDWSTLNHLGPSSGRHTQSVG